MKHHKATCGDQGNRRPASERAGPRKNSAPFSSFRASKSKPGTGLCNQIQHIDMWTISILKERNFDGISLSSRQDSWLSFQLPWDSTGLLSWGELSPRKAHPCGRSSHGQAPGTKIRKKPSINFAHCSSENALACKSSNSQGPRAFVAAFNLLTTTFFLTWPARGASRLTL